MISSPSESPQTTPSEILSPEEISHILDVVERPALLVSNHESRIEAGNLALVELSGYTRKELRKLSVEKLFPDIISFRERETHRLWLHSREGAKATLITRRNREVEINIRVNKVGLQAQFILLEITPLLENQRLAVDSNFEACIQLINTFQEQNLELALNNIVQIGHNFLAAEAVAIYKSFSSHPNLKMIASFDESQVFPTSISTSDLLTHFSEPTLSPPYPSALSPLYYVAIENKSSYFVSIPLINGDDICGVLVAIGPSGIASLEKKATLLQAKFLAAVTERCMDSHIQVDDLQQKETFESTSNAIESTISEHIPEGVIYLNPDLTINKINPAIELILGYAQEEILERPFGEVLIGTDRLGPCLQEALEGISTSKLSNLKLHHRDGHAFPVEATIIPVKKPQTREVIQVLVFLYDLSQEEKYQIQTQHLEQRALVGDMNAIFAHEIRNPINNITTGIQLLERTLPEDSTNKENIKRIQHDCDRLTHIVKTILDYSRIQSAQKTYFALPDLIKQILTRWHPRMKRIGIEYHIKVSPGLPEVFGDRRALGQVFTNLIDNAVQAMEKTDGGTLAFRIHSFQKSNGEAAIKVDVLDTGSGIPESARGHIFKPFFTTKSDGTGLGLSITKQIITRHKGSITVAHLPEGTVFHITLPAASMNRSKS